MKYRVWDTDIGKLFGVYDAEDEALALVRLLAESYGEDVEDLALTCERDDGSFGESTSGAALMVRAGQGAVECEPAGSRTGAVIAPRRSSGGGTGFSEPVPLAAKGYECANHRPRHGLGAPGRKSARGIGS